MNWRIFRATERGPVQVGEVEGSTVQDAMRLATALGMTSAEAEYFGLQLEGLGATETKQLSDVTVGEFAALIGLNDIIKARDAAHGERVAAETARRETLAMVADIKGVQSVNQRQRISTPADLDTFAAGVKHTLNQHGPRYALVVIMAWVDDTGAFSQVATGGGGVN